MNIPGLKDVLVTKVEEVGEKIQIHVEIERKFHRCPSCGNRTKQVHDYRIQRIQHLKWFERKTELFYKRRRYVCECGKRFSENVPFVERYQRTSIEWNQAVSTFVLLKVKPLRRQVKFMVLLLQRSCADLIESLVVKFVK